MGIGYSGSYTAPRVDLGEAFKEYFLERGNFIGREVFPVLDVPRKEANLPKLRRESMLATGDTKRGQNGAYNRAEMEAEEDSYRCEEHGIEYPLGDDERELYRYDFDAELAALEHIWLKLMLNYEKRVKDIVFDGTTNFTVANGRQTDVTTVWTNVAAAIINDVLAAKEKVRLRTGMNPNTLIVSQALLNSMVTNTGILEATKYVQIASYEATVNAMLALFGLEKILVARAVENTAKEGQAASISDIWSAGFASVARVATGGSIVESCLGRTLVWAPDAADLVTVEEYREEQTRSSIFRGRHHVDEKALDLDFAQLLKVD